MGSLVSRRLAGIRPVSRRRSRPATVAPSRPLVVPCHHGLHLSLPFALQRGNALHVGGRQCLDEEPRRLRGVAADRAGERGTIWRRSDQPIHLEGSPDRKSTRLNSSHHSISYAVYCLKKK